MKEKLTKELVLAVLDLDKKMRMEVNASDYVTGGILSMECEDGRWRLVVFLSKLLNETERSYEIHNKEMLAVIMSRPQEVDLVFSVFFPHSYFLFKLFFFILFLELGLGLE